MEVYLIRRQASLNFLGGFSAFPGGAIEPEDLGPESQSLCPDFSPEEAASILGGNIPPREALAYWLAGIRELFEETGVLLARPREGSMPPVSRIGEHLEKIRERTFSFQEMIKQENLLYDIPSLTYFDHWITPPISPIRYDVRFFFATTPRGQSPLPCPVEFEAADWIWPPEALERYERGDIKMVPPTRWSLERLAAAETIESLKSEIRGQSPPPSKSG